MLERTSSKLLPLAARAADAAPATTACCNACRTCVTTNVPGLVAAGGSAALMAVARVLRRQPDEVRGDLDKSVGA